MKARRLFVEVALLMVAMPVLTGSPAQASVPLAPAPSAQVRLVPSVLPSQGGPFSAEIITTGAVSCSVLVQPVLFSGPNPAPAQCNSTFGSSLGPATSVASTTWTFTLVATAANGQTASASAVLTQQGVPSGVISGLVTDQAGEPVPGTCVTVNKAVGPVYPVSTITGGGVANDQDNTGGYYALRVPPGRYLVSFSSCRPGPWVPQVYRLKDDPGSPAPTVTPTVVQVQAGATTGGIDARLTSLYQPFSAQPAWLQALNRYRKAAGLSEVWDQPAWDAGLWDHMRYLADTPSRYYVGQYRSMHIENPASPYYTKLGAEAGSLSDLDGLTGSGTKATPGFNSSQASVNALMAWMAAPFHMVPLMLPSLGSVALVAAPWGDAGLDVWSGQLQEPPPTRPLLFPANGSAIGLTRFGGELPNPLQTCNWSSAGLGLIALLPYTPGAVSATLTASNGTADSSAKGSLCVVDQHDYRSTDPVYGPTGLDILQGSRMVILFPRQPLKKGTYHVVLSDRGYAPIAWAFRETTDASSV